MRVKRYPSLAQGQDDIEKGLTNDDNDSRLFTAGILQFFTVANKPHIRARLDPP